jgi:hypothetical protein
MDAGRRIRGGRRKADAAVAQPFERCARGESPPTEQPWLELSGLRAALTALEPAVDQYSQRWLEQPGEQRQLQRAADYHNRQSSLRLSSNPMGERRR